MHALDLRKLIAGFVPCCTDIVALYTDGADEGVGLHVESLSKCGVPRIVGARPSPSLQHRRTSIRVNAQSPPANARKGRAAVLALQYTDIR